jgi:hypothetical protein
MVSLFLEVSSFHSANSTGKIFSSFGHVGASVLIFTGCPQFTLPKVSLFLEVSSFYSANSTEKSSVGPVRVSFFTRLLFTGFTVSRFYTTEGIFTSDRILSYSGKFLGEETLDFLGKDVFLIIMN